MNFHRIQRALFTSAIIGTLMSGACTTDDGGEENPCAKPELSVQTPPNGLEYYITDTDGHGFYELQYGSNGFSLGSGTVVSVNSQGTITNMNNGTYDIYVRGNCGGSSWSDWNGPQSFIISGGSSGSCGVPYAFNVTTYTFSAQISWLQNTGANYYQVQYGPTGFTFGTGTTVNSQESSTNLAGLIPSTVYDYYVRANCGGTDFSAWSGVNSFVTD